MLNNCGIASIIEQGTAIHRIASFDRFNHFAFQPHLFCFIMPRHAERKASRYKRIVLKLSGEALREAGARENISPQIVREIAERVKEVADLGVQISIVIGGGNIWRGLSASHRGMDRTTADYMGMLATVINGLALQSCARTDRRPNARANRDRNEKRGRAVHPRAAPSGISKLGRVVIFVAGTGNPYFSTDTTAALRASEIGADIILKATKVDGIYDRDPKLDPTAKRYEQISLHRSADQAAAGDGFDRFQSLHGQQNSDRRFRHEQAEQYSRHRARQKNRHAGQRLTTRLRISNCD